MRKCRDERFKRYRSDDTNDTYTKIQTIPTTRIHEWNDLDFDELDEGVHVTLKGSHLYMSPLFYVSYRWRSYLVVALSASSNHIDIQKRR